MRTILPAAGLVLLLASGLASAGPYVNPTGACQLGLGSAAVGPVEVIDYQVCLLSDGIDQCTHGRFRVDAGVVGANQQGLCPGAGDSCDVDYDAVYVGTPGTAVMVTRATTHCSGGPELKATCVHAPAVAPVCWYGDP